MANPFYNLIKVARQFFGRTLTTTGRIFSITTPEVYSPIDNQSAIEKGYNGNIAVYSIVNKDIKKFASLPRYVFEKSRSEEKAYLPTWAREVKAMKPYKEGKKLQELLDRPNAYQGQDSFFETVRAYYKVTGEAFIWLNRGDIEDYRNADGSFQDAIINRLPIIEMVPLPSQYMTVIPDQENPWGALGYVLEAGDRVVIRKDDIIHWKNTNLEFDISSRCHMHGMTPLKPGAKTVEESNSMSRAAMRQAQNNGAAGAIYNETMDKMTPEQQSNLKRVVDAKVNNTDVAGSVATLQGKWGYLDFGRSAKDMMLIEGQKFSWQQLCFLFGVPVELFAPDTTHTNKEQAQVSWIINEILPDCKKLDGELNRVLLKAFNIDTVAFIATDGTQAPELQKEMVNMAKVMQDIWSISPDEVREFLNYERLGGKFDEPWVPNNRAPISDSDDGSDELLNQIRDARRNDMADSVE